MWHIYRTTPFSEVGRYHGTLHVSCWAMFSTLCWKVFSGIPMPIPEYTVNSHSDIVFIMSDSHSLYLQTSRTIESITFVIDFEKLSLQKHLYLPGIQMTRKVYETTYTCYILKLCVRLHAYIRRLQEYCRVNENMYSISKFGVCVHKPTNRYFPCLRPTILKLQTVFF